MSGARNVIPISADIVAKALLDRGLPGLKPYPDPGVFPPCLYFLFRRGKLTYVGQGTNLPQRIHEHHGTKDFDAVAYVVGNFPRELISEFEGRLIDLFQPPGNKVNGATTRTVLGEALWRQLWGIRSEAEASSPAKPEKGGAS